MPAFTVSNIVEIVGLAGTLLVGGMKFGSLDSRVSAVEQRKDQAEDVASVKAQVQDIKGDLNDVKQDVRDIKRLLLSRPK